MDALTAAISGKHQPRESASGAINYSLPVSRVANPHMMTITGKTKATTVATIRERVVIRDPRLE